MTTDCGDLRMFLARKGCTLLRTFFDKTRTNGIIEAWRSKNDVVMFLHPHNDGGFDLYYLDDALTMEGVKRNFNRKEEDAR